MSGPTFGPGGYPSDETLDLIEKWPHTDFAGLLAFVRSAWEYPEYWKVRGRWHRVVTGGWSGNEDLIGALKSNAVFWAMYWQSSHRGGLYHFKVPVIKKSPTTLSKQTFDALPAEQQVTE